MTHDDYMRLALEEAHKAAAMGKFLLVPLSFIMARLSVLPIICVSFDKMVLLMPKSLLFAKRVKN